MMVRFLSRSRAVALSCAALLAGGMIAAAGTSATAGAATAASTQMGSSAGPHPKTGYYRQSHSEMTIIRQEFEKVALKRQPYDTWCGTGNTSPFALTTGFLACMTYPQTVSLWTNGYYNGPVFDLFNSSGARVWFHQNANGSGWADCFPHGMLFAISGRDRNPGNIQLSSNSSYCIPPSGATPVCLEYGPFAGVIENGGVICYQGVDTYDTSGLGGYVVTHGTGARVWIHKAGLSLCLNNNNGYSLIQFWVNFDNLQITNVTQGCP